MKRISMAFVVAAVLLSFGSYARAGEKAHAYGKHKIKGEHVDMAAVKSLLDESIEPGVVEVESKSHKSLKRYKGRFKLDKDLPIEESMMEFIEKHRHAFGLKNPKNELKVKDSYVHYKGRGGGVFQQYYKGIPVWKATFGFGYENGNEFTGGGSNLIPTSELEQINTTPAISEEEAVELVNKHLYDGKPVSHCEYKVELNIYYDRQSYLAYMIEIKGCDWVVCQVDAVKGDILYEENKIKYFDDGEVPTKGTMTDGTVNDVHVFRYNDIHYLVRRVRTAHRLIGHRANRRI